MYLDLVVLALLVQKPHYGYEIKKHIEISYNSVTEVNTNTIYPILKKFVEKGYTTKEIVPEEGKPNRIVYTITNLGRKEVATRLRNLTPSVFHQMDECMIRLMYFDWMDSDTRLRLIEGREKCIKETEEKMKQDGQSEIYHPLVIEYGDHTRRCELYMLAEFKKRVHDPCLMDEEGNLSSLHSIKKKSTDEGF